MNLTAPPESEKKTTVNEASTPDPFKLRELAKSKFKFLSRLTDDQIRQIEMAFDSESDSHLYKLLIKMGISRQDAMKFMQWTTEFSGEELELNESGSNENQIIEPADRAVFDTLNDCYREGRTITFEDLVDAATVEDENASGYTHIGVDTWIDVLEKDGYVKTFKDRNGSGIRIKVISQIPSSYLIINNGDLELNESRYDDDNLFSLAVDIADKYNVKVEVMESIVKKFGRVPDKYIFAELFKTVPRKDVYPIFKTLQDIVG